MDREEDALLKGKASKARDMREFLKRSGDAFGQVDERDEMIKLAVENSLTLSQTQKMLILSGKGKLYPRFKRDAVIIHAISNGKTLAELNEELAKLGEIKL